MCTHAFSTSSALIGAVVQHLLESRRYKIELQDQERILQKQFAQQGETLLKQHQLALESEQHLSSYVEDLCHHGIWNHHGANDAKGATWSAIAAEAGHLNYNYPFLVYFLKLKNRNNGWQITGTPYTPVPIPSIQEFLEILEVRRDQIKEVIDTGDLSLKWKWPAEWGYVPWSGPIIIERIQDLSDECYLDNALREYSQIEVAINQYRTLHNL